MKRLGYRGILFLSAFLAFGLLAGCGAKAPPMGTGNDTQFDDDNNDDDFGNLGDLDDDSNGVIQGAFDDSQDDLNATQQPNGLSGLSQQQQYCSSASSQSGSGTNFFTQLTNPMYSAGQSACFAGAVNPTYLLAQNYTQISVLAFCQQIALNQLNQVSQTPQNIQGLFFWATGFILRCAQGTIGNGVQYAGLLGQGVGIRRGAVRAASGVLRNQIRSMRP